MSDDGHLFSIKTEGHAMKKQNKSVISVSKLKSKKESFKKEVDRIVSGEISVKNNKEKIHDKLLVIKDEINMLREKKFSYASIKSILEEKLELKVSEPTLRKFFKNESLYNNKNEAKEESINKEKTSIVDARKELSKEMKFD